MPHVLIHKDILGKFPIPTELHPSKMYRKLLSFLLMTYFYSLSLKYIIKKNLLLGIDNKMNQSWSHWMQLILDDLEERTSGCRCCEC